MISLKNLSLRNLQGYPGRTAALVLFSALMAIAIFGGSMVVLGVQQGIDTVKQRLGADIVVTPADAENEFDAQTVLVQAEPNYFYMDAGKTSEIQAIDGVAQASPQLFLASAKASCCSARLQIIAFDPATDFVIQPWIAETYGNQELGLFDIFVGSNVTVYDDHIIRLYDNDCKIVGQFLPTGSTLDNAVYMNFDTMKALIESSVSKGMNKYADLDADHIVSSVMVKVDSGRAIDEVAQAIEQNVEGVSVATSAGMVSGVARGLEGVSGTISALVIAFWLIGLVMTMLIFTMTIHARRREFATMRVAGASSRIIKGVVVRESLLVNLAGGIAGIVLSVLVLYAFSGLLSEGIGAGFVVPGLLTALVVALATLLSAMIAAALSAVLGISHLNKLDASLVLKEGE